MAKIRTFARIKPAENLYDDFDTTRNRLYLRIPDSYGRDSTLYNRTRAPVVNHEFKYSQVFNPTATQEEVFQISAKNIIDGFLEGYNGTIFAYGQTASGKTYTMQGDLTNSEHKGLAPRSLTRIFAAVSARKEAGENITMHCSFLEIYQEVGYDLLKTVNKNGPGPTTFAKVSVVDGPQGAAVVKNLSIHVVNSEEAAQNLLAQGELNRKVAETAMNNRSTRSHAVFTVYLSSRKGDLLIRSKMHFVDLAGSERVCKTGVKGLQLSEAKYINLSLHYLEGVIIALHQDATTSGRSHPHTAPPGLSKSWSASTMSKRPYSAADMSGRPRHIPYRNSLLTMLLKDSLGGNCLTTMIATISLEVVNLSESISTCRFAQRVSCISNLARKNEEIDDKSMIKRLRTRVAELEAENNLLKHGGQLEMENMDEQEKPKLTAEDRELCQHVVKDFLNGRLIDPIVAGVTDPFKFRECMSIFKKLIKEQGDKSVRLAEKLKQQPAHIQEAFYTGGRYHEAPLAKPNRRQEISFRDDANALTRNAYSSWTPKRQQRTTTPFKPTILKPQSSGESKNRDYAPTEAWQLQIQDEQNTQNGGAKKKQVRIVIDARPEPRHSSNVNVDRPKPQSAGAALRRSSTPFERRRNQEVKQLNQKVEANHAQQLEQASHLKAFKKTIVEQEFEITIQSLKRKLEVTRHQLNDQRVYTLKLQKKGNDKELLEQEQLVERQLQKRVDKMEAELNTAHTQLNVIKHSENGDPDGKTAHLAYRSVQDKFSGMTKRDGTIDTLKVKTTLQQQQKLQTEIQKNIDQQRAVAINKHLEVKEMSTRQKLEEFKRKLAESRGNLHVTADISHTLQAKPSTTMQHEAKNSRHDTPVKRTEYVSKEEESSRNDAKKTTSQIFRHRIEQEKPEHAIDTILSKYRTSDEKSSQYASERMAQVDQILAKYKHDRKQAAQAATSKAAVNPRQQKRSSSSRLANERKVFSVNDNGEKSLSPISEKDSGYVSMVNESANSKRIPIIYSRVKVPNSAMEYDAAQLSGTLHQSSRRSDEEEDLKMSKRRQISNRRDIGQKDEFDSTLKSMLEKRQGHHRRRTSAWVDSSARQPEVEKQDLLKIKLQQFLVKQSKRKQQQSTRSQVQERSRLSSAGFIQSNTSNSTHDNIGNSKSAGSRQPRRHSSSKSKTVYESATERNKREFSHRMSHYQTHLANGQPDTQKWEAQTATVGKNNTDSAPDENLNLNGNSRNSGDAIQAVTLNPSLNTKPSEYVYSNLQKLNNRNKHASKVRQIQNAAATIQRAWRRHCHR